MYRPVVTMEQVAAHFLLAGIDESADWNFRFASFMWKFIPRCIWERITWIRNYFYKSRIFSVIRYWFATTFHLTLHTPSLKSWLMMRNSPISEVLPTCAPMQAQSS